jgi:hypothetical protein
MKKAILMAATIALFAAMLAPVAASAAAPFTTRGSAHTNTAGVNYGRPRF